MPYNIKKADGTHLVTVQDNTINLTASSLSLIGRNALNFGQSLDENFISFSCHYSDSIKALPTLLLFPNPTSSVFTVDAKKNIYHYEMCDVLGKVLISQYPGPITRINADISSFPAGVYYLNIYFGDNENKVFKILKE